MKFLFIPVIFVLVSIKFILSLTQLNGKPSEFPPSMSMSIDKHVTVLK
jgi:hypothetical protein